MSNHYSGKLFSNFFALSIVQGANFLLPILVIPYVISKVGATGFGEVSVAQVIMMFFTTVADYGFNLTATRDVSLTKENSIELSRIFSTVILVRLLLCALLFSILLLGITLVPFLKAHSTLYLLSFVSVIGQSILTNWLFQGVEKMKFVLYISLLARIIFVLLVFFFMKKNGDQVYFLFFSGVGNIIAGLLSIIIGYRFLHLTIVVPTLKNVRSELTKGWHITISNLSVSVYMYVNILLLRVFTNDAVVGYYSVAEKIVFAARQVLSVYFQAIYPQVCQLAVTSKKELSLFFEKYYRPFLISVFAGCLTLFLFPGFFIRFFLNGHYVLASEYLQILSFVPFIVCLNIPAYQLLIINNEKKSLLVIFTVGTLLNIGLSFFFIPAMGATATSYIVLITEVFITIGLIFASFRKERTRVRFVF